MIKIVLDTNIYDKLEQDSETANTLSRLICKGRVEVVMPREVARELWGRPQGMPTLFPVQYVGNTVARAGLMCAGDSLGGGYFFDQHKGDAGPGKVSDALIADAASWHADWFVSEDDRCIRRFETITAPTRCVALRYAAFAAKLRQL